LFPDYEFIHSNFPDYIAALKQDLPADLSTIHGELTSQATDGWYTLANTASSRIYLKQANTKTERLLENVTEPLVALAGLPLTSTQDKLDYAWKTLLQNHPHDSICGCGVDPVHAGMLTRFATAQAVGESLSHEALQHFSQQVNTQAFPDDSHPFVVLNTSGVMKQERTTVTVELARALFADGAPEAQFEKMSAQKDALPRLEVIDAQGQVVTSHVHNARVQFNYDLPDDRFRVPYMALYVDVDLAPTLPAFGWRTFALQAGDHTAALSPLTAPTLENDALKLTLADDGSIAVLDKANQHQYADVFRIEDTGDIGNEYIYRQSADNQRILNGAATNIAAKTIVGGSQLQYDLTLDIPVSADERLAYEQQAVIDITQRQAKRSTSTKPLVLHVTWQLFAGNDLRVQIHGDNQMHDHRLRVLIHTGLETTVHQAESIFEVVERPNTVGPMWKNPENPQHQQAFVGLHTADAGIVVGNYGLNEYEVAPDGSMIAVTLLRSIGEMGDWGYFATPDAQSMGTFDRQLQLYFTDGSQPATLAAYQQARAAQIPVQAIQTSVHSGKRPVEDRYLSVDNQAFAVTATQWQRDTGLPLVRGFNMTNQSQTVRVQSHQQAPTTVLNLVDDRMELATDMALKPAEIRTYGFGGEF